MSHATDDPLATWALDREIVLSRVIAAPVARVVAAWTDPELLSSWFGPDGLRLETQTIDVRPGGLWQFAYVTPDGDKYPNRIAFLEIGPQQLRFDHRPDEDD